MNGSKKKSFLILLSVISLLTAKDVMAQTKSFNQATDLLLLNYDCKTDVDDIHTMAAFATLSANSKYKSINYHAVAGAYGVQEGLYVPPYSLLPLIFDTHWTDAHNNLEFSVREVFTLIEPILKNEGAVWIAEAGQSDFTAELVKTVKNQMPTLNTSTSIHVVQHSDWNESVTSAEKLDYVKKYTDYIKIPDGNGLNNGTPGFKNSNFKGVQERLSNPKLKRIWKEAIAISNKYNGKEGRYTNEAIANGGLDFSDLAEVCWILGIQDINDIDDFFNRVLQ
ncbi:MAG: hypothetical protein ISP72_07260 [Flavobacteriaceae bacterium]|nr:hypothetical protein [Flavobacteriaceae bacterium]|tara:strand:- start:3153 stop:3992 length:840 start_codon:yes stop_codon:yes gene_type:complete